MCIEGTLKIWKAWRSGAAQADGVIHLAFDHGAFGQGFSKFAEVCENDKRAIEALGAALIGSDRPLLITSGTGMGNAAPGQPATEDHFALIWVQRYLPPFQVRAMKRTSLPDKASMALLKLRTLATGDFNEAK